MTEKTKLGLPFFDDAVGGVYFDLPTLLRGTRDSDKSLFAAHFLAKVVRTGEKAVVFCERSPESLILSARSCGFDFEEPVRSGQLVLVPIRDTVAASKDGALPLDDAIAELHSLVVGSSIHFAVFDSVVPWLAVLPEAAMKRRVDAFVSEITSSSLTSLLLVHRPASQPAEALVEALARECPVDLELETDRHSRHTLRILRYRGRDDLKFPIDFPLELVPGKGFCTPESRKPDDPGDFAAPPLARRQPKQAGHRAVLFSGTATAAAATPVPCERPASPARHRAALFPAVPPAPAPAAPATAPAPAATPDAPAAAPAPETQRDGGTPPADAPQAPRKRIRFSSVID